MIEITYLRSSSLNAWTLCQQQFFIEYTLGIRQPTGKKAQLGTILHKVMECLANARLARQENHPYVIDDELGRFPVSYMNTQQFVEQLLTAAFNYYTHPSRTVHKFFPSDKTLIAGWIRDTLSRQKGLFDPRTRHIISAEKHFDIPLNVEWAQYDYTNARTQSQMKGSLRLQGTIDLITKVNPYTYEIIDWKTGQRKDWATDKEKDFAKLSVDPQLRIYHYAATQIFPDIKNIVMTINYVRDGGPFTMAYDGSDLEKTLEMLRIQYTKIKQCVRPTLKSNGGSHWFCKRVCHYGRTPHPKDPSKTICRYIKDQIKKSGIDNVMRNESNPTHNLTVYQKSE